MKSKLLLFFVFALPCLLTSAQDFTIPDIRDLPRIEKGSPRPPTAILRNSAFILKLHEHAPLGDGYVIITDHQVPDFLEPLEQLAAHRKGTVIQIEDLGKVYDEETSRLLRKQLLEHKPQYVAVAPRLESYRENMLLGLWELFSTLDDDKYLDVFPGILLASSAESFQSLIQRTMEYKSIAQTDLKPMAISQVPSNRESRSLQKAGVLRNVFGDFGLETPIVAIYTPTATEAPKLEGNLVWNIQLKDKGNFVKKFAPPAMAALTNASLVVMHGHGIPGMSCSVDIDGIPVNSNNQVVLSGSCFAAAPTKTDFPRMTRAPGGYNVAPRQAFATRYIDRGATVFFGHMRLSSGFPHLYPVLEQWTAGKSVGEAYQQLVNGIIDMRGFGPGRFVVSDPGTSTGSIPQNTLLYVIFGDPALIPFKPLMPVK
ncbi:MAG: hypothetical protein VX738_16640 [Planctomycetota bacterium]|nr:hypothetical protein [Planctomycetota bacterium]